MNKHVIALGVVAAAALTSAASADIITSWTFENLASSFAVTGTSSGNVASTGGAVTGNASGTHASATTAWSSPAGNGSPRSLSSNGWAVNDYYQFTSSSTGYSGITIQWDQTGSATGPRNFNLMWSTDGSTFTQIGSTLTVTQTTWNNVTASVTNTFGPIAGPAGLDNQATIYFRIVDASTTSLNGGTVASTGTGRVDNVIISGTLPTPGAAALMGMGLLASARRRRA